MKSSPRAISKVFVYDILLALLYSWAVFQAYIYDAKTQTTGILIYIVVYLGFTLLVRSPLGVILMNGLSALTLPSFFSYLLIYRAGAYFDFQPFIGEFATLFIAIFQTLFALLLITFGKKFLTLKNQYPYSFLIAIVLTLLLTLFVKMV